MIDYLQNYLPLKTQAPHLGRPAFFKLGADAQSRHAFIV